GNNIPNATQQSIAVNAAGSYSVQVVDLFGCSAVSDPVVVSATDNIPPVAKCKNVTVALNANGAASVSAADINDGSYDNCSLANIAISGTTSYNCSNAGQVIPVTLTVTDASGNTSSCTANVTVTAGTDTDGDGVGDICDADDDNDGITDVAECNNSNFYWSNPPTTSGNTATGVINGVNYTYTSSQTVLTTPSVFAHNVFPVQYNIPNIKCIQNIYASSNTLTFSSPISNPVLVFASIGQSGIAVPIEFSSPIEVLWSTAVVQNSATRITGNEGYAIVRLNGTFSSISFDYLANENYVNFLFGADFQNCIDTDGDGTLDYLDTDSDNDGCPDAIEGSQNPALSQTSNGRLTGGVDAMGIPLIVNGGQGIGTSKNANANCFCQPGIDKTAPVITCPADISVNATSTAGAAVNYPEPTVNDDCQYTLVRTSGPASGSTFPIGTTTVTYKATNLAGLSAECSFNVSVIAVAPSVVCPSNISVNNDPGQCGANVSFAATETIGIPASTITYSHQPGSNFPVGTTTVTATATNIAGSSSCTFTVTVSDNENPVPSVSSLPVITAECAATAPVPTATDNCGGLINGVPSGPVSFTSQGTHTITWTYTDAAGNSTSQQQTVVIDDNTPPVIACPFNIAVNADPGTCGAVVQYNQPSATDNCGVGTLPTSIPGYTYKGMFGGHTYFVSNTQATPENAHAAAIGLGGHLATIGSAAENSFIAAMRPDRMWIGFTDRDVEGTYRWVTNEPILYTNWSGGEPNNAGGNEDWAVINWSGSAWNDWYYTQPAYYVVEFEGGAVPTTLVSGLPSGSVFPIGVNTVTYSATDAGGNTVTCSFTVTVTDNQAPQIVCPSNISVNSDNGKCAAKVTVPSITVSDNCDVIRYTETFDSYPGGPAINRSGLLRPWTGGAAGVVVNNIASSPSNSMRISNFQDQLFLLGDRTSGKWDVRFRMFVPAGSAGYYNIQHFEAEGIEWAQEVQFSSNGTGRLRVFGQLTPFSYPQGQWFDVQQSFDLDADQTTLKINGIVVKSWQFSMLANAAMGTKQLGGFDFFGVTANMGNTEPNPAAPAVFFIDDISVAGSSAPMSGYIPRAYSISYPVGTTPVTVKIQDGSGNSAACSFNVTVTDNQPPVITGLPANIVKSNDPDNCSAVVSWIAPTATDNCSGVTISQTSGPGSGSDFPVGTTTVTYTATDGAGNAVSSSFTVTVNDTQAPALNGVPADATASCTAVPEAADVTAADNCPGVGTVQYSEVKTDGSCAGNYTLTRTWSVTDAHNNSTTATQVITVQDNQAPVISCPASVTVNCQDNTSIAVLGSATATDDCSGVTITSNDVSTQDADSHSAGHYNYTITRTWTATDG
ncbi:MAG TPA: HYR domain-containing protein, partial [Chitinophagaceae bacterium]